MPRDAESGCPSPAGAGIRTENTDVVTVAIEVEMQTVLAIAGLNFSERISNLDRDTASIYPMVNFNFITLTHGLLYGEILAVERNEWLEGCAPLRTAVEGRCGRKELRQDLTAWRRTSIVASVS